jgi:hypothetical protein
MPSLLDFYRSRFGNAVKRQGNGWNGPCPLCGGVPGRSDRFMVWPDRDQGLGDTCAKHGLTGVWSCRQCGKSGDTIAYLMLTEDMDFKAALAELGIEGGRRSFRRRPAPAEPPIAGSHFTPAPLQRPSAKWGEYAAKLLDEAAEAIKTEQPALRWLASRGIPPAAVARYRIGYVREDGSKYPGRWRARSALGLEPKEGDDGRMRDKIFIPRGIIIPSFAVDGSIMNMRIRRLKADISRPMANGRLPPKYLEIEGSSTAPMFLRAPGADSMTAYFITEAELDAVLIHYAAGACVGAVAVRTNRGKPDAALHGKLLASVRICVALDFDEAGAAGVPWWEDTYRQAVRWPVPDGKDPGDAFHLGVDISEWVAAGLPESIALPEFYGQADISLSGQEYMGERGKKDDEGDKREKEVDRKMHTSVDKARVEAPMEVSCRTQPDVLVGRTCEYDVAFEEFARHEDPFYYLNKV